MNGAAINTLFAYHYEIYDRIWDIVLELLPEQFVKETDYSLGSVRNQLLHVMEVDNRWLARLQYQPLPDFVDKSEFPHPAALRLAWDLVRNRVLAYVNALTADDLEDIVELDFPHRGGKHRIFAGKSCCT